MGIKDDQRGYIFFTCWSEIYQGCWTKHTSLQEALLCNGRPAKAIIVGKKDDDSTIIFWPAIILSPTEGPISMVSIDLVNKVTNDTTLYIQSLVKTAEEKE